LAAPGVIEKHTCRTERPWEIIMSSSIVIIVLLSLLRAVWSVEAQEAAPVRAVASHPGLYSEAFVIPPDTFSYNHAPSLTQLPDGEILITWCAGSRERSHDVQIYSVRYSPTLKQYSPPRAVVRTQDALVMAWGLLKDRSVGNPTLFLDDKNILWLFCNALVVPWVGWNGAVINYMTSKDFGTTWSAPARFISLPGNLVRDRPLRLDHASFLLPAYTELLSYRGYVCSVAHDQGKIVSKACEARVSASDAIQPTIAFTKAGAIVMLLRDRRKESIRRSWSYDSGKTWSIPDSIGLPNPSSAVAIATLDDGRVILAYNHSSTSRSPLSLALSEDNGKTFKRFVDLEQGPGKFAYPSLLQTRDSSIHVVYSYNLKTIKHLIIKKELLDREHGLTTQFKAQLLIN
jgi:predicted neuraminidase